MTFKQEKKFRTGEIIFHRGDEGEFAFIVDEGRVEIYIEENGQCIPVSFLGPGEIFGEMAIIDDSRRSASARAYTDCTLSLVSKHQLSERVESADSVVRMLINILLNRNRVSIDSINGNNAAQYSNVVDLLKVKHDKDVIEKIRLEKELEDALEKEDFNLHFQPIVSTQDGSILGVEALVRWNSPTRGLVRPDIFMGIAEETSLIVPLGQWILQKACEDFAVFKQAIKRELGFNPDLFISINVSGRQLNDYKFFPKLNTAVKKNKLKHSNIKLEITERILIDGNYVLGWISNCHNKGYRIALDDFGTGYSSLSYLHKLNVDQIKIDKSFIHGIGHNSPSNVIIKAIVEMSKGLNKGVIAEGIETKEQLEFLKELGCEYGQGYLFSRPLPLDKLIEYAVNSLGDQSKKKKAA